jgi:hypothetical protein
MRKNRGVARIAFCPTRCAGVPASEVYALDQLIRREDKIFARTRRPIDRAIVADAEHEALRG